MGNVKQINIKNQTYYIFNDMINVKSVDSNLLKKDKKSFKNNDISYIGYVTIKSISDYENIHSVNPLYLIIGKAGRSIEESNGNKYLVLASIDINKDVSAK